jgi:hypothetical protein
MRVNCDDNNLCTLPIELQHQNRNGGSIIVPMIFASVENS